MTQQDIARRLRSARASNGLTQDDVARTLGIARTAVVQIERGGRSVTSIELARLAELYRVDIRRFVEAERPAGGAALALFRSFAEEHGEAEAIVLQECLAIGRAVTDLERLMGLDRRVTEIANYSLPVPRSRIEAVRQGVNVAMQERYRLGIGDTAVSSLADLLERQGIRTASVRLPRDVAGLMVVDAEIGTLVVVNEGEAPVRRRFSLAHEYAHVILDADAGAVVTRSGGREDWREVRANAFAANLLLPHGGIRRYLATVVKEGGGRLIPASVDDDWHSPVEVRDADARDVGMHDVVLLAGHFDVSRQVAIYRMRNIGVLKDTELQILLKQEREGQGRRLARLLGDDERQPTATKSFTMRLISLAFEALSRGAIDASRFRDLVGLLPDRHSISRIFDELMPDVLRHG